jgi:hypothetical protein
MTTKTMMICAAAALWCAATAVKAVLALIHRESYVISWWDAAVAGTGRKLGRGRTAIKLAMMIVVTAACALAATRVIAPMQVFYAVIPVFVVTAIVEMSAPKPQRRGR